MWIKLLIYVIIIQIKKMNKKFNMLETNLSTINSFIKYIKIIASQDNHNNNIQDLILLINNDSYKPCIQLWSQKCLANCQLELNDNLLIMQDLEDEILEKQELINILRNNKRNIINNNVLRMLDDYCQYIQDEQHHTILLKFNIPILNYINQFNICINMQIHKNDCGKLFYILNNFTVNFNKTLTQIINHISQSTKIQYLFGSYKDIN